jgi:hypothetical protein
MFRDEYLHKFKAEGLKFQVQTFSMMAMQLSKSEGGFLWAIGDSDMNVASALLAQGV